MSWLLPIATGENYLSGGTLPQSMAAELYISGITSSPSSNLSRVNLSTVSKDDMERRLGQILNTFHLATLEPYGMTGKLSAGNAFMINNYVVETVWLNRYHVDEKWLSFYFISCLLFLAAVICGFVLKTIAVAPDILGYMSTLTKDNTHVRMAEGGTSMWEIQRSGLLRNVRARLGDIEEEGGGVGFVAIASGENARKLERKKLYSEESRK